MYFKNKENIKHIALALTIFLSSFILAEAAWVTRNYISLHRIVILEDDPEFAYGRIYSHAWFKIDRMVFNWGEDAANFDKGSLGAYYRYDSALHNYPFPAHIFNNVTSYNRDSLIHLKNMYMKHLYSTDSTESARLEERISQLCAIYQNDYTSHNKLRYLLLKPLKSLKLLLISGGTQYIPYKMEHKISQKSVLKILSFIMYFYVLLLGFLGIFYCIKKRVNFPFVPLVAIFPIAVILTIIIYSEIIEPRYFVHGFTILILFASFLTDTLLTKFKKRL